jgi:c-di-GMP-binding flagellar brake protein YcgR
MSDDPDRRRYRRVNAPVLCRPAALSLRPKHEVRDISAGGLRVFSDDKHKPGERLEMELFFSDGATITLSAEVMWVEPLPADAPAKFDVGLRYANLSREDVERIEQVLVGSTDAT